MGAESKYLTGGRWGDEQRFALVKSFAGETVRLK